MSLFAILPGSIVVMAPFAAEVAEASGLPLLAVLMIIVNGFSTAIFPYQGGPIPVGLRLGGDVLIAGVAGLVPMAYGADFGVSPYSRQLMYFGAGLFGASYVLDVIGTAQNSEQLTFTNSNRVRGATASAKYGYLELGGLPKPTV